MSIIIQQKTNNLIESNFGVKNIYPDAATTYAFNGCSCEYFYPKGQLPLGALRPQQLGRTAGGKPKDITYEIKNESDFWQTGSPVYGGADGIVNYRTCTDNTVTVNYGNLRSTTNCLVSNATGTATTYGRKAVASDAECSITHGCSSNCSNSGKCKQFNRGITENIIDLYANKRIFVARPGNKPKNLKQTGSTAIKNYGKIAEKEYEVNVGKLWDQNPFTLLSNKPIANNNKTVHLHAEIILGKTLIGRLLRAYDLGYFVDLSSAYVAFSDSKGKRFKFEIETYFTNIILQEYLGNTINIPQSTIVSGNETILRDFNPAGKNNGSFLKFKINHSYEIQPDTEITITANPYKSGAPAVNKYGPYLLSRAWVE